MAKPEDFTQKRESTVMPYSELGKETQEGKLSKDKWGVGEYKGELVRFYTDPKFIHNMFTGEISENLNERGIGHEQSVTIIDFGGGDGILLDTVTKQLEKSGLTNIHGINMEINKLRVDEMYSKLLSHPKDLAEKNRTISAVMGTITAMPFHSESFDGAISRFVLQYMNKEQQVKAIKEMVATLKPGAKLVLVWPLATGLKEQADFADEFDNNINSIITGLPIEKVRDHRHFTSLQEMGEIAKNMGVECDVRFFEDFTVYMSAESYIDRFNINDAEKQEKLRKLFNDPEFKKQAEKIGGMHFVTDNGKTIVEYKVGTATFKK